MGVSCGKTTKITYESVVTCREACVSVIECNPHHIAFLPARFVDDVVARMALRLGARLDEIPEHLSAKMPPEPEEPMHPHAPGPFHPA
ncbi:hypothetical protein [Roseibium sp. RKSG952]|uniref:hypothetical protein n=1 Tax=Roseibium sp. RKSG952 TaxID=2529384 RepID=UPI0012BC43CD|nr:hypothetical protein [Roseibium sp. RKSG952]MTH95528.1 hypothetical protein [Roseibium sp. RKSG952]